MAIGIRAWAEVDADVPGTVELTGPWHLHCAGLSRRRPATYIRRPSQPSTSEKDGRPRPASTALPGNTRLRSRYLPKNVSISKSFAAGNSSTNAFTDTYDPPGSCTVVADTRQQLDDLTLQHVRAVAIWVGRMEASPLRTQLTQLADRAYAAASANDRATALNAMTQIKDLADPLKDQDYDLYGDVRIALALLTQPVPAT